MSEDDNKPVTCMVIWDDAMNPDLRLMRAIQALIDASAANLTDEQTSDVLEYLLKKYHHPV